MIDVFLFYIKYSFGFMFAGIYSFLISLNNYDICCYASIYVCSALFLLTFYYDGFADILQYIYGIMFVYIMLLIFNYQLLKFNTVDLTVLPLSLKMLVLSLVMFLFCTFIQNTHKKKLEQHIYVSTNSNNNKMNNYNYHYNNDAFYSEPNTSNVKSLHANVAIVPNRQISSNALYAKYNNEYGKNEDIIQKHHAETLADLKKINDDIIDVKQNCDASNAKIENLIHETTKKFEDNISFQNNFGKQLTEQIEQLSAKLNKQKEYENSKLQEELDRREKLNAYYKEQLLNFEQQLMEFDEEHKKQQRQNNVDGIQNQPSDSIKNDCFDDNVKDNIDLQSVAIQNVPANVAVEEVIEKNNNTEDVAMLNKQDIYALLKEMEIRIEQKIFNKTQQFMEKDILLIKERINGLEINIAELTKGTQGMVDRTAKLLEFMTTVFTKNHLN